MFTRRVKTFATTTLAATALGMTGLLAAGTANASALDNKFLAAVEQAGISVDNPQAVIQEAKNVCSALDQGYSPDEVAAAIKKNSDLTAPQVKSFMIYSANAYCPQHTS